MNKKDLLELEEQINNEQLSEQNLKRVKWLTIYKSFIILGVLLVLLIVSLVFSTKIIRFSHIFGELFFNLANAGAIIYYTLLAIGTLSYGLYLGFTLYKLSIDEKWYKLCYKIYTASDIPIYIIKATLCVVFIAIYIFTPCNVSGPSMNDTLLDGNKLILWDLFYTPQDGDIVVFDATGIDTDIEESFFIKRVAAVAGDTISYDFITGGLYVNGERIETNNAYNAYKNMMIDKANASTTFTVPEGYIMVLGDNRAVSRDSRYFGLIEESRVYGKVILRIFPFDNIGTVN